jgi:hypothetical protein
MAKPRSRWSLIKIRLGDIQDYSGNPRMSTKAQAERIIASEKKFGQPLPFLVGPAVDGRYPLLDGHQRKAAWLTVYGEDFLVDAMVSDRPLTDEEHREMIITLHAGATGSWDWDALSSWQPSDLKSWGMDEATLKQWNNDANNLKEMLRAEMPTADVEPQIDRAEELREKWGVQTGDLWQLGDHRLICGDCTDRAVVERVMGGEKAGVVVTDPPWNVGWKYSEYKDDLTPEEYKNFSDRWRENAERTGADLFFVAMSMKNYKFFHYWFPMAERIFAECQNFVQHTNVYMQYAFNPILVWNNRKDKKKSEAGKRDYFIAETSITKSTPDKELAKVNTATRWLPTVEYMVSFSNSDDIIYEPFGGTGTTIIACENLKRKCRAIEISPGYVSVTLERYYQVFGILPVLLERK